MRCAQPFRIDTLVTSRSCLLSPVSHLYVYSFLDHRSFPCVFPGFMGLAPMTGGAVRSDGELRCGPAVRLATALPAPALGRGVPQASEAVPLGVHACCRPSARGPLPGGGALSLLSRCSVGSRALHPPPPRPPPFDGASRCCTVRVDSDGVGCGGTCNYVCSTRYSPCSSVVSKPLLASALLFVYVPFLALAALPMNSRGDRRCLGGSECRSRCRGGRRKAPVFRLFSRLP